MSEHESEQRGRQGAEQDETPQGDDTGERGDDGQEDGSAPEHGSDGGAV